MQNLKDKAPIVLRVGLGITFIWIGYFILQNPEGWGSMILPWAADLLPASLKMTMIITGIFDIAVGVLLTFGIFTHIAALLGFLHLLSVVLVIGINGIAVRDIGLALATLSLTLSSWPESRSLTGEKN